jgi:hypothetical protein
VANSNYNALETTLRYEHRGSRFLLTYTYAKSIDQGSSLGEQLNPIDPRRSRAISAWDLKHDFAGSYTLALPLVTLRRASNRLTEGWSFSGTTRFATGFPVTLFDNSDNSLLGTLGNGANNYLLDTPQHLQGAIKINTNGRNGRPAFNTSLFPEETLGQLGNAKRRNFYGPGIENFDMTLQKSLRLSEAKSLEFRAEAFNAFNHAQFYGASSVDGQREDPSFWPNRERSGIPSHADRHKIHVLVECRRENVTDERIGVGGKNSRSLHGALHGKPGQAGQVHSATPDFLWTLMALADLIRLSLREGAHVCGRKAPKSICQQASPGSFDSAPSSAVSRDKSARRFAQDDGFVDSRKGFFTPGPELCRAAR